MFCFVSAFVVVFETGFLSVTVLAVLELVLVDQAARPSHSTFKALPLIKSFGVGISVVCVCVCMKVMHA